MVKNRKDPRKWTFEDREELPIEWIHGLFSYIRFGSEKSLLNLPNDFKNGLFPTNTNENDCGFSKVSLKGDFINNENEIFLESEGNIFLELYPNLAPFKKINSILIKSKDSSSNITLTIKNYEGTIIYSNVVNFVNNKAIFNLNNVDIGLETLFIEIQTDNLIDINNIEFNFELLAEKIEKLFNGLAKVDSEGNIDKSQLNIKYISGAENEEGEELPLNQDTNNVIIPANVFPDLLIDENGDVFLSWKPSDMIAQMTELKNKVDRLSSLVENSVIPYGVGDIISTTNGENPSVRAGWELTEWEAYGKGRVMVGYDSNNPNFNTIGKIGGTVDVTLTEDQLASHAHPGTCGKGGGGTTSKSKHTHPLSYLDGKVQSGSNAPRIIGSGNKKSSSPVESNTHDHSLDDHNHPISIGSKGGNKAHNNLQPYIVVYLWRRTK